MELKLILSIVATSLAFAGYVPYIRDIKSGKSKPHVFSWLIWSLVAYIAGFAQLVEGGGVGSFPALVTATISLWISYTAYRDGSVRITRGDRLSLFAAIAAIPIWIITNEPLLSVVIVSIIDILAFWPTIRKSFSFPYQETMSSQIMSTAKHFLTIAALQNYNIVTVLFPATLAITNVIFVFELVIRRNQVKVETKNQN